MPRTFALDEQETTFTIDATDRTLVRVYSNDPVMITKLKRVGAKVYRECVDGGMFYDLPANQLHISMPPRKLTPEQRKASAERFAKLRRDQATG